MNGPKPCCLHYHAKNQKFLRYSLHSGNSDFFSYFTKGICTTFRGSLFMEWPEYIPKNAPYLWIHELSRP